MQIRKGLFGSSLIQDGSRRRLQPKGGTPVGGYYTTSRSFGPSAGSRPIRFIEYRPGANPSGEILASTASTAFYGRVPSGSQVTLSYRTGGSEIGSDEDEEKILHAQSSKELRRSLKDEARRNPSSLHRGDTGHDFETTRYEYIGNVPYVFMDCIYYDFGFPTKYRYEGPLIANPSIFPPEMSYGFPVLPASNDLTSYGVEAVNRTIPTNSVASLATALAELKREGLPALFGSDTLREATRKRRFDKSSGSEYLNAEFGWKPLVSDLTKTMLAVSEASSLWRQLVRDSGKQVRRGYTFPVITSSETASKKVAHSSAMSDPGFFNTFNVNYTGSEPCTLTTTLTKTTERWFKGAYTYHLPDEGSAQVSKLYGFEEKVNHLFGTRLTPEVVWNLAPWSWLADWHFNIGQNISNAVAMSSDSLVLKYGYLMERTTHEMSYTLSGWRLQGNPVPQSLSGTFRSIRKRRVRSTPYGFGLNPASFTNRQWAILGALGLTKSPNSLH